MFEKIHTDLVFLGADAEVSGMVVLLVLAENRGWMHADVVFTEDNFSIERESFC